MSDRKPYDTLSVKLASGMLDELRRLARERDCTVSEYVRRTVALDREVWDHHGGQMFVLDDGGGLVRIAALPRKADLGALPEVGAVAVGRPVRLAGRDEVRARRVDEPHAHVLVSIGDEPLVVGEPDVVITTAWAVVAVVHGCDTAPAAVAPAADSHAPDEEGGRPG